MSLDPLERSSLGQNDIASVNIFSRLQDCSRDMNIPILTRQKAEKYILLNYHNISHKMNKLLNLDIKVNSLQS